MSVSIHSVTDGGVSPIHPMPPRSDASARDCVRRTRHDHNPRGRRRWSAGNDQGFDRFGSGTGWEFDLGPHQVNIGDMYVDL